LAIKGLGPGGAERLLVDVVAAGDHSSFDYQVAYVLDTADALVPAFRSDGTTVHPLGAVGNLDLRWLLAFRRLLLGNGYDIVHFHLPYTAAFGRLVVASLPRRRRPVTLYTEHSLWNKAAVLVKILNRATIGLDRSLIAVSEAAFDALPSSLRARAQVVVHGVDLHRSIAMMGRRDEIRTRIRAELGVPPGELLAVTVANLRSEKGYDVLLDAAHIVDERRLPIRFAAAGHGALDHEMAERHRALGLGDRFRFLGHRHDALELLTAADIVVLPSHQEGLPVVLMEASSLGATMLATSVGGVGQVIQDGVNGLIVPPGRPEALADAIERLGSDPDLRARLGQQAAADSAAFDVARASGDIERIYRTLLTPHRRPRGDLVGH
jgi:glycosyltransferase involved in cell wall biosynthesis